MDGYSTSLMRKQSVSILSPSLMVAQCAPHAAQSRQLVFVFMPQMPHKNLFRFHALLGSHLSSMMLLSSERPRRRVSFPLFGSELHLLTISPERSQEPTSRSVTPSQPNFQMLSHSTLKSSSSTLELFNQRLPFISPFRYFRLFCYVHSLNLLAFLLNYELSCCSSVSIFGLLKFAQSVHQWNHAWG
jgi:hypothetical protein